MYSNILFEREMKRSAIESRKRKMRNQFEEENIEINNQFEATRCIKNEEKTCQIVFYKNDTPYLEKETNMS